MAAEALLREPLPPPWNYGVTQDGRIFFINEESAYTTWLHPVYQHPIQSGHFSTSELPRGWEQGSTPEGVPFYVDHFNTRTTRQHPVTGEVSYPDRSLDNSYTSQTSPPVHPHPQHPQLLSPSERSPNTHLERQKSSPKKKGGKVVGQPLATRSKESPISMKGWLSKQDSGGLKQWRKRWFVLSDFCLFYYKGPEESKSMGSILLPSYRINPCTREDNISRKHAFKAEHDNMRTYHFAADHQEEMRRWMNAMSLASILQRDPKYGDDHHDNVQSVERELNPHMVVKDEEGHRSGSLSSPTTPHGYNPASQNRYPEQYREQQPYPQGQQNYENQDPSGYLVPRHPAQDPYQDPPYQSQRSLSSYPSQETYPQYRDQNADDSSFYQPGQLQKQKPLADLSKFDSNTDFADLYGGFYNPQAPQDLSTEPERSNFGSQGHMVYGSYQPSQSHPTPPDHPYQPDNGRHPNESRQPESPQYGGEKQYHNPLYGSAQIPRDSPYGTHQPRNQDQRDHDSQNDRNSLARYGESLQQPEPMSAPNQRHVNRGESPVVSQLHEWRDRVEGSPRLSQGSYSDVHRGSMRDMKNRYQQNNNNPIYENLNGPELLGQSPGRPPLPAAFRDQLVLDLAETQTPGTRNDMLLAADISNHRQKSEPLVFQYPESPPNSLQHQGLPESYMKAKHEADEAERSRMWEEQNKHHDTTYPDTYWRAKNRVDVEHTNPGYYPVGSHQRTDTTYNSTPGNDSSRYKENGDQGRPAQRSSPSQHHTPPKSPAQARNTSAYNTTQNTTNGFDITTIKEDPTMTDEDILVTKKLDRLKENLFDGNRLRLSISAGDLIGKSHEELVLLLIQLRRSQSRLGDAHGWYKAQMDVGRGFEKEYKKRRDSEYGVPEPLEEEHAHYQTLKQGQNQIQKQVDISKPLVNLVDNLVTMGSIYGGNNLMLASQYKQNKLRPGQYQQPKKMIEFSRKHQEEKLTKEQEEQLQQLQEDEADLEEKLQQLYLLDRELQDHSFTVTSLQEDWELLQKALEGIKKQEMQEVDPHALKKLGIQRQTIEQELSKVRHQLADASKLLEETAADNARVENEVILLRKKIMKGLDNRPDQQVNAEEMKESLRTKDQLEAEITSVQTMIDGLSKQGAKLGEVMSSLRRSMPDLSQDQAEERPNKKEKDRSPSGSTYAETDMDTMETHDLGSNQPMTIFKDKSPNNRPTSHVFPQTKTHPVREIIAPPGTELYSRSPPVRPSSARDYHPQQSYTPPPNNIPQHGGSHQSLPNGSHSSLLPPVNMQTHPANSPPQRNSGGFHNGRTSHSSLTDLRPHQRKDTFQRPASATFNNRPEYVKPQSSSSFHSEPSLAEQPHEGGRWQQAGSGGNFAHAVAYNEPSSIAFSQPYGQQHTHSTNLVYQGPPPPPPPPPPHHGFEIPDYVNIGPMGEVNTETNPHINGNQGDQYSPLDINDAEENMKRFYGILPKDKPRATTVRDVKKRENERRSRDRNRRSYAEDDEEDEYNVDNLVQRNWRSSSMPGINTSGQERSSPRLDSFYSSTDSPQGTMESTRLADDKPSATSRLFPRSISSIRSPQYNPSESERVRRMSDILTPRPFTLGGSKSSGIRPVSMFNLSSQRASSPVISHKPSQSLDSSDIPPPVPPPPVSTTVAKVRPVFSSSSRYSVEEGRFTIPDLPVRTAKVKPMSKKDQEQNGSMKSNSGRGGVAGTRAGAGRKGKDRERFLTISSSQPISMESPSKARARIHSAAGDLITSIRHSDAKMEENEITFDDLTIDREVLFVPDKVEIPERYVPDSDDEVTEEEAMVRQVKSDRIRKMLAAQSLQEWKESELHESTKSLSDLHLREELKQEKQRREEVLDIRQALAREVSQKTRQVAEMRRKTMSETELRHVGLSSEIDTPYTQFFESTSYQRISGLS